MVEFLKAVRRKRGAALMGIVNTTPDSFYDGGRYTQAEAAERQVDTLLEAGADIIDIGGESTRPGSELVPAAEQMRRVEPALVRAIERGACVSIDTTLPEVANFALERGARIVNDISCLERPELAQVAAHHSAVLILMHSRGRMDAMPGFSAYPDDAYDDIVSEVRAEWRLARDRAVEQGLAHHDIWLDPGLGFHKNASQSLELLERLDELRGEGAPIVVGPSRKSFINEVHPSRPDERLGGTVAACLSSVESGASVLRVHDVRDIRQALEVWRIIRPRAGGGHHA